MSFLGWIKKLSGGGRTSGCVRAAEPKVRAFDAPNCLDGAYAKMRGARTEANYRRLVEALREDLREDASYPDPRTLDDMNREREQGGVLFALMRTPAGTLEQVFTSVDRTRDREGPEGSGAVAVRYVRSSCRFANGRVRENCDGLVLNAYDDFGGVVIPRKDVELVLAHRYDGEELDVDPREGVRLNRALAYWWLVEEGRYEAPSAGADRLCPDCGHAYCGSAVCPRCGHDTNVSDEVALEDVAFWPARHPAHLLGLRLLRTDRQKAFDLFRTAARAGDAGAMVDLGKMVADAARGEEDVYRAIRLYRLALSVGHPAAAKGLARRYATGLGLKRNPAKAFALAKSSLDAGFSACAYGLSVMSEAGDGCPRDPQKALDYARKGSDAGDADSTYQLSRCQRHGIGTEVDVRQADAQLMRALEAGSARAWATWTGEGASDLECRVRWAGRDAARWGVLLAQAQPHWREFDYAALLRQAAERGVAVALNDLGAAYAYGYWNVQQDHDEAEKRLTEAAARGHAQAHFNLGLLYESPAFPRADRTKAGAEFLKSAELGHAPAQYHLWANRAALPADCYVGRGADAWLEKAAAQNYPPAVRELAAQRAEAGDDRAAFRLIERLAEAGDAEAEFLLGKWYQDGKGVDRDACRAFRWISDAAWRGVPDAMNEMGRLYDLGLVVRKDPDKAWEWIRRAAAAGSPVALCNLADRARAEGRNAEALELYRKSADLGFQPARDELSKALHRG